MNKLPFIIYSPRKLDQAVILLTCNRKIPGSNVDYISPSRKMSDKISHYATTTSFLWFILRLSNYTVLNDRKIGEQWIEKDFKGSGCGKIKVLSRYFLGGCEKNHEKLGQVSWCLGWETNQASPSYKSRMLPPQQSASFAFCTRTFQFITRCYIASATDSVIK
jgi:hypothetical protein